MTEKLDTTDKIILAIAPDVLNLSDKEQERMKKVGIQYFLPEEFQKLVDIATVAHRVILENTPEKTDVKIYDAYFELADEVRKSFEQKEINWRKNVENWYDVTVIEGVNSATVDRMLRHFTITESSYTEFMNAAVHLYMDLTVINP